LNININDDLEADINTHFESTFKFIKEAILSKGKVLVYRLIISFLFLFSQVKMGDQEHQLLW